ncbi:MotE family protein [Pseudoroseicyclus aestuarii]|uniref:Flagellar motility protein MotE (MotC chaperone) n=1 Tax=Pseudoroseicyclus aestuarii TaxID=1795041 RepID=A0A318SVY0_9RHOB|nr:hypothetical protein [Pseudoroseicyclus aestuarii]PYE84506.1 flagellar motility protein MotE (MotC chaperone) [Pseudoroseicyclus aestuarii]
MRPARLLLSGLALAALFKAGASLGPGAVPQALALPFVRAAEAAGSADDPETAAATAQATAPEACPLPEAVLETVTQERGLLGERQQQLAAEAAELELAREQLEIEAARLETLRGDLEAQLDRIEAVHEGDVARLVNLYRAMKPDEAAAIMNELDLEVSVMVLGDMVERDAAPILAQLSPVRAQAISRIIFERGRMPGDQRLENIRIE